MPVRTVGEYLKRWGFTQKPVKRAKEQNQAVKQWLNGEYPKIAAMAKKEKAQIYWAMKRCTERANMVRGYGPKGKTPVLRVTARGSYQYDFRNHE